MFHRKWTKITGDQWVLETLLEGLKLEFMSHPCLNIKETSVPRYDIHESVILTEISVLLEKNVIEHVPVGQENLGYYSTVFVVPKRQGGLQPILNLKPLNQIVVPHHFKMEILRSIMKALKKGDYAVTLGLADAYFHIPIHTDYKQFLRFRFLGHSYQFRAMPFGLKSAPRVFTKIMAVLAAYLRKLMIQIFILNNLEINPYLYDLYVYNLYVYVNNFSVYINNMTSTYLLFKLNLLSLLYNSEDICNIEMNYLYNE
ncbi:Hypothetical predicted protein [Mytilus galloprovincialis]|uniref:Reverse transcriptase domain-containing protein n=1 Tax=Mytilus galloprovincialis TaxID=29158 RepID=A0A8B6FE54_MYTGA|nr:Hypothetical predicted protein [Mytilus galloprovincialis]